MRLMVVCGAGLAWLASATLSLAEPADPAQVIAHKFWLANQPKEQSAAAKPAAAAPVGNVKAAQSQPASPDADYENDMLRRAREEQAERAVKSNAAKPTPSPAPTPAAEAEAAATPPASPDKSAAPLPLITPPQASKTAATPKIEAVAPPAAPPPAPPAVATKAPSPPSTTAAPLTAAPVAAPASPAAAPQPNSPLPEKAAEAPKPPTGVPATVLLALDIADAGKARGKSLPDLIVCINSECYLSGGLSKAASMMARSEALTLKGTEEKAPDGCRGMFGCVYRNVAVPDDARITVLDLSLAGNGDTGAYSIAVDKSCRKDEDELICENGLMTQTYRVWIVPEATATTAGNGLLEEAVAEGLTIGDVARASDK